MMTRNDDSNNLGGSSSIEQQMPTTAEWSAYAESYRDGAARITSLHAADLIVAVMKSVRNAKTILDVGCGTGSFAMAYLQFFPKGIPGQTIICTDRSEGMVEVARQTIMAQNLPRDFGTAFVFQVEDGTKLEGIADNSIDLVVSIFAVFLIPERDPTFAAIRRVLVDDDDDVTTTATSNNSSKNNAKKKNKMGVFATTAWTSADKLGLLEAGFGVDLQETFHFVMNGLNEGSATTENAITPTADWIDPKSIQQLMSEGSFENVRIFRAVHSISYESAHQLWNLVASMNPFTKIDEKDPSRVANVKRQFYHLVGSSSGSAGRQDKKGKEEDVPDHQEKEELATVQPVFLNSLSNIIVAELKKQ